MKTMKIVIMLAVLLAWSTCTWAGSGSAIVPNWLTYTNTYTTVTQISISNISNNDIAVTVTVYLKDGTVLSNNALTYDNFASSNTQLNARNTGLVTINTTSVCNGFAVIEWENLSGDDNSVALVAHGFRQFYSSTDENRFAIPINMGMPF